jgi:cytokinin dehydrogenase
MVSRRDFVAGLSASVVVLGFDPLARGWVSEASAATFDSVPDDLQGMLVTDPATLATYAHDVGSAIQRIPVAVLLPASAQDIATMVKFCKRHGIKVAARGQGHTTFGQSQVDAGLVVDMSTLNQIHSIGTQEAVVEGGALWRTLVEASVAMGLTPPVLTGYIQLSIGGTLSVGGVSSTNREGVQIDRVRELEVVTGEGEIKTCSECHNPELFEAVLGGLGQFGIITRATLDMVPAPPNVHVCILAYTDNAAFFKDMNKLLKRGELDDVFCLWLPDATGQLVYNMYCAKFFDPASPPDTAHLLRGLTLPPTAAAVNDQTYLDYVLRTDVIIDFFRTVGLFDGVMHPWFDVWLPKETVEEYVGDVIPTLTPEDVGPTGFVLLFPQKRSKLKRRFFAVPDRTEWVFLFDILTAAAAPGFDPAFQRRMLDRNRRLFEKARRAGGTRYAIGSLEFDKQDWRRQYGKDWNDFSNLKQRFDPKGLLTPGPGIF